MPKPWGKILLGTRIEKMVTDTFFSVWTELLEKGQRPGDRYAIAKGQIAHRAANSLARALLKSDCDSLFFLDSDADIEPDFLNKFRDLQDGWDFDVLQAFYLRRQWPPEAVWLKKDAEGILKKCIILDDATEDVSIAGLHATLIRREVFEKMAAGHNVDTYDWFYYPRNEQTTEDAAFSEDAIRAGLKVGATSNIRAGHIAQLTIGWETYQEYLHTSGYMTRIERYSDLMGHMIAFTGLSEDVIANKAAEGSKNVERAWKASKPEGQRQTRDFYGNRDNGYLYDLFYWNTCPYYIQITEPLKEFYGRKALVIGAGLGSEAALLKDRNQVDIYELPGILNEFCEQRLGDSVCFLNGSSLEAAARETLAGEYDLIVAIDTIEHVHTDEITRFLHTVDHLLADGGILYAHNTFDQQGVYPMHFDHSGVFNAWTKRAGLTKESDRIWRKAREE